MMAEKTIRIDALQYQDDDDSLAAAESDYAQQHGLQGFDLAPRWASDERDEILLTVPAGPEDQPRASSGGSTAPADETDAKVGELMFAVRP